MSDAVIAAIIGAVCSMIVGIVSAVISARATGNDVMKKMEIAQAVTDTKLEELTKTVQKHNNLVERTYKLEEQASVLETRIDNLEKK